MHISKICVQKNFGAHRQKGCPIHTKTDSINQTETAWWAATVVTGRWFASCWSTRNDPRTGQYVRSIIVIIVWIIGGLCSCASSDFIPVPANSYSNNIIPTTLYFNGHTTMARHQRRTEDARSAGTTSIDKVVCSLMLVSISVPKAIDMCDAMRPSSYELLLF